MNPKFMDAPFTPDQVESLNGYQDSGVFHPFTCANHHEGDRDLVATAAGWVCRGCDYTQNWAHEFMGTGEWRKSPIYQLVLGRKGTPDENAKTQN